MKAKYVMNRDKIKEVLRAEMIEGEAVAYFEDWCIDFGTELNTIAKAQHDISFPLGVKEGKKAGIKEVVGEVAFMWNMIKYCPQCGSYLPCNLNGTRTHTCHTCNWSGESLKSRWHAKLKEWRIKE